MQCLPVLSFHEVDERKQELTPLPWGPARRVSGTGQESGSGGGRRNSRASNSASQETATSSSQQQRSTKAGPQAMGRTLTPDQARAREQALAQSALTQAHVPIPFADALGAHHLTALPVEAGGGVVVWSETSISIVPPPTVPDEVVDNCTTGKRRKSSGPPAAAEPSISETADASVLGTSPDSALLARSPSSKANEHGKRRRSSVKVPPAAPSASSNAGLKSPSSSSQDQKGYPKILRISLPRPVQITSAVILRPGGEQEVREKGEERGEAQSPLNIAPDGQASLTIIFGTAAGATNALVIRLHNPSGEQLVPVDLEVTRVGSLPRLSGPQSLVNLGEGFLYAASASGDSTLARLLPSEASDVASSSKAGVNDRAEMVSPPTSPVKIRRRSSAATKGISSALAHSQSQSQSEAWPDLEPSSMYTLQTIRRFPSLAPTLDFVVDGDADSPAGGVQARIVAACGTGPDGAIAVVKNGVVLDELSALDVPEVRRIWPLPHLPGLLCSFADQTTILSLHPEAIEDVTETLLGSSDGKTLEATSLANGTFVRVSETAVDLVGQSTKAQWRPQNQRDTIVAASIDQASAQALIALQGGRLVLISLVPSNIQVVAQSKVINEVSSVHIGHGLAAVGQWKSNTVRLFTLPTLEDVTPSSMDAAGGSFGSLPRSVLIHDFRSPSSPDAEDRPRRPLTSIKSSMADQPQLWLLVGLASGSIVTSCLSLPDQDSISRAVGLYDRKTSVLGRQPLRLTPFTTADGKQSVLACNGETPTVIWAEGRRITVSTLAYPAVLSAAPLNLPNADPALVLALPDRLQFCSIKDIGRLSVTKTDLGLDNPVALAGLGRDEQGYHSHFAVLTTPYRPEGNATREDRPSKLLVFDSVNWGTAAQYHLEKNERANAVEAVQVDGKEFIIVGTGFVNPDDSETTDGRILGFTLISNTEGSRLVLRFEQQVNGNVYAVSSIGGRLVAAVNSTVFTYDIKSSDDDGDGDTTMGNQDDDGEAKLVQLSRWAGTFIACTLSPIPAEPTRIVVGDALRALCVLSVESSTGKLQEIARDCDPFWTTSCCSLDSETQTFVGADISFNLYTSQRATLSPETKRRMEREAERRKERMSRGQGEGAVDKQDKNRPPLPVQESEEVPIWSHIMERRGAWHYGDLINRFRHGSLVSKATASLTAAAPVASQGAVDEAESSDNVKTTAIIKPKLDPRLLFCSASGGIGVLTTLDPRVGQILSQVEDKLPRNTDAGRESFYQDQIPAEEWRTLRTDHRTSAPTGFVDGDYCIKIWRKALVHERKVVAEMVTGGGDDGEVSAQEIDELIEGLGRVC